MRREEKRKINTKEGKDIRTAKRRDKKRLEWRRGKWIGRRREETRRKTIKRERNGKHCEGKEGRWKKWK